MWDVMEMTEDLVSELVYSVKGSYETEYHTQSGETYKVNWAKPWRRVDMIPELEAKTGEKFPPASELHTDETNQFLRKVLQKCKVECSPPLTNSREPTERLTLGLTGRQRPIDPREVGCQGHCMAGVSGLDPRQWIKPGVFNSFARRKHPGEAFCRSI